VSLWTSRLLATAGFSASTLILTCPHSFPTPTNNYVRLATKQLQCALSLQEFHRARDFFSFVLTNWNTRLNSPGKNQCLAAGNAGSGEGGSGEPDNWCRLTTIGPRCQTLLKVPHNFESDRLQKLSNEIDDFIDSNHETILRFNHLMISR
jgi:hypothetical protein